VKRFVLIAAAAILALFGGAVAIIDWATGDVSLPARSEAPASGASPAIATAGASAALDPRHAAYGVESPLDPAERKPGTDANDVGLAGAPARDGEQILEELEQSLLGSEPARRCVAEGEAPDGAEIRLTIDPSGVTYRLGDSVDSSIGYCLMMQALPDVLATVSAPKGVRRAERSVRIPRD
jgi:hypothetical protein